MPFSPSGIEQISVTSKMAANPLHGNSLFILRGGGFIQGNQYKIYRMTPLSYHAYSVSESSSQDAVAYFKNFYVCFFITKPLQGY